MPRPRHGDVTQRVANGRLEAWEEAGPTREFGVCSTWRESELGAPSWVAWERALAQEHPPHRCRGHEPCEASISLRQPGGVPWTPFH